MRGLPLLLALLVPLGAQEPIVVIVHPECGVQQLSREQVANLFLGRERRLSPNLLALPVELTEPSATWARFYRQLVGKELAEINAYWARLYFSGQAQPPHRLQSPKEVLDMVSANRGAIGFVEKSRADRRVRIVFTLGGPQ